MVIDEEHIGWTCHICSVEYRERLSDKLIFLILLLCRWDVDIIVREIWWRITWILIIPFVPFFLFFTIFVIIVFIIIVIFLFLFLLLIIVILGGPIYFRWGPFTNGFVFTFNNIDPFENAVFNAVEELIMLEVPHLADLLLIYVYRNRLILDILDSDDEVTSSKRSQLDLKVLFLVVFSSVGNQSA